MVSKHEATEVCYSEVSILSEKKNTRITLTILLVQTQYRTRRTDLVEDESAVDDSLRPCLMLAVNQLLRLRTGHWILVEFPV